MDTLTFKGKKYPVRISYSAIKNYQKETGGSLDSIGLEISKDLAKLEIILFYALKAGALEENISFDLKKEHMEAFLDENRNYQRIAQIVIKQTTAPLEEDGEQPKTSKKK